MSKKTNKKPGTLSTTELLVKMYTTIEEIPMTGAQRTLLSTGLNHVVTMFNETLEKVDAKNQIGSDAKKA